MKIYKLLKPSIASDESGMTHSLLDGQEMVRRVDVEVLIDDYNKLAEAALIKRLRASETMFKERSDVDEKLATDARLLVKSQSDRICEMETEITDAREKLVKLQDRCRYLESTLDTGGETFEKWRSEQVGACDVYDDIIGMLINKLVEIASGERNHECKQGHARYLKWQHRCDMCGASGSICDHAPEK